MKYTVVIHKTVELSAYDVGALFTDWAKGDVIPAVKYLKDQHNLDLASARNIQLQLWAEFDGGPRN